MSQKRMVQKKAVIDRRSRLISQRKAMSQMSVKAPEKPFSKAEMEQLRALVARAQNAVGEQDNFVAFLRRQHDAPQEEGWLISVDGFRIEKAADSTTTEEQVTTNQPATSEPATSEPATSEPATPIVSQSDGAAVAIASAAATDEEAPVMMNGSGRKRRSKS